jgi:hypothetical protein
VMISDAIPTNIHRHSPNCPNLVERGVDNDKKVFVVAVSHTESRCLASGPVLARSDLIAPQSVPERSGLCTATDFRVRHIVSRDVPSVFPVRSARFSSKSSAPCQEAMGYRRCSKPSLISPTPTMRPFLSRGRLSWLLSPRQPIYRLEAI